MTWRKFAIATLIWASCWFSAAKAQEDYGLPVPGVEREGPANLTAPSMKTDDARGMVPDYSESRQRPEMPELTVPRGYDQDVDSRMPTMAPQRAEYGPSPIDIKLELRVADDEVGIYNSSTSTLAFLVGNAEEKVRLFPRQIKYRAPMAGASA